MNYYDTFIQVAPDCPVTRAVVPQAKGPTKTVAVLQYEMLSGSPYTFTQEEVLFEVAMARRGITPGELAARRDELWAEMFSKPQACLRASPLPKQYGWGLHFDAAGRIGLYPVESQEYREFVEGKRGNVRLLAAMRSRRA